MSLKRWAAVLALLIIVTIPESVSAGVVFEDFSYDGYIDDLLVSWYVDFDGPAPPGEDIGVECTLRKNPGETQTCDPDQWFGIGSGSCQFSPPDYNFTHNTTGGELKTYPNTIRCEATGDGGIDVESSIFYPVRFDVRLPENVASVVGEKNEIAVSITNMGMLEDLYNITAVAKDSRSRVSDTFQMTSLVGTNGIERAYVGYILTTSEQQSIVEISVRSNSSSYPPENNVTFQKDVNLRGSDKSLPGIGSWEILQILILSSLMLVTFLL